MIRLIFLYDVGGRRSGQDILLLRHCKGKKIRVDWCSFVVHLPFSMANEEGD